MNLSRRFLILSAVAALSISLWACGGEAPPSDSATIYLVRHAEKTKDDNPGLTEAGQARADALAARLNNERVDFIHSTDTRRTLATAAPLAMAKGLDVQIYNGRDLQAITDKIKFEPGTHVVVGHSNTTPQLAGLISGQVMDIMEETEYSRFIEIRLKPNGELVDFNVTTYGAK